MVRAKPEGASLVSSRAGALAWSLCGLTLALILCAVTLAVWNGYDLWRLSFLAAEVGAALVGGLISARRPNNPVGWFVLGHALCFSLAEFARQYALYGLVTEPGSLPFARAMAWPPY